MGVAPEKLFLAQSPTGGTFGYKFSPTMEALVGVACLATGRPVSLRYDYHQQMTYTGKRSPFFIHLRLAADAPTENCSAWKATGPWITAPIPNSATC